MRVQNKKTKNLKFDPRNARTHDRENIEAIKASLERFGQQKPIVIDKSGTVIAGNGTLQAALELGWDSIKVVCSELDADGLKAFALADNRTAELAGWDEEILVSLLEEISEDMVSLGFDESFLEELQEMSSSYLDEDEEEPSPEEPDDVSESEDDEDDEDVEEEGEDAIEPSSVSPVAPASVPVAPISVPVLPVRDSSEEVKTLREPALGEKVIAEELDASALAEMRRREQVIATGMEVQDRESSFSSVETFRLALAFNDERAVVVKEVLSEDPAQKIFELCEQRLISLGTLNEVLKKAKMRSEIEDSTELDEALDIALSK